MDTPTPIEKEIELSSKENKYTLLITKEAESIKIRILTLERIPPLCFENIYEKESLNLISNWFTMFEELEEIAEEIQFKVSENKYSITEEKYKLLFTIKTETKKYKDIVFELKKKKIEIDEAFIQVCNYGQEMIQKNAKIVEELKQVKEDALNQINQIKQKYAEDLENKAKEYQQKYESIAVDLRKQYEFYICPTKWPLINDEEITTINNWINPAKKMELTLLYKMTKNGSLAATFHTLCNNKGPTLVIVKSTLGYKFGGYTTVNWSSRGSYVDDSAAIIFSLDKNLKYNKANSNAIYDNSSYGPTFGGGHDFYVSNQCDINYSSYCNTPSTYTGCSKDILTGGEYNFRVVDYEVYLVKFV